MPIIKEVDAAAGTSRRNASDWRLWAAAMMDTTTAALSYEELTHDYGTPSQEVAWDQRGRRKGKKGKPIPRSEDPRLR